MVLTLKDLETHRFGVVCAQLDLSGSLPDLATVNRTAEQAGVAMISTRVPVNNLKQVHALEADGYRLMDTLVYYGRALKLIQPASPLTNGLTLRSGQSGDRDAIETLARGAFSGYMGHYHADLRLDDGLATEAYVEWAVTSLSTTGQERFFLVAIMGGKIAGFLTLEVTKQEEVEVMLNAVDPGSQRRGIYQALFEAAMASATDLGIRRISTSTQINNYAVQKVWTRLGLVHERSYYTLHKWFD